MSHRDPRDIIEPGKKEWFEFRAAFSAVLLHAWLLRELDEIDPHYFATLRDRLDNAVTFAEGMRDSGGDEPPYYGLFEGPRGSVGELALEDADLLGQQLFPFRDSEDDVIAWAHAQVLVGLHSALEGYCRALGIKAVGPLPLAIQAFLKERSGSLDAETARQLIQFDETRHLYVHRGGVVDDKFVNAVPYNRLHPGERCPVTRREIDRCAAVVWNVAATLKAVSFGQV